MISLKKSHKIAIVIFIILLIALFDYATTLHLSSIDIIYRELYFIPILLGAYWFGKKGGIFTSLAASALYLPCAMMDSPMGSVAYFSNLLEIALFNAAGYFVGTYYDLRRTQFTLASNDYDEAIPRQTQNILFCIYSAGNTISAAHYIADNFSHQSNTTITVTGFLRIQSQDFFATKNEFQAAFVKSNTEMNHLMERTKTIILQGGISETNVRERTITIEGKTIANSILEEQHHGHYDMIIVGCTKMPKAQEFLFGNTNIAIVREAPCPVLIVC